MEINIPQRLKDLRAEHSYTQQNVADGIDIKKRTYQAYEEGRAMPPLDVFISMAAFYGYYSIDKLLGIEGKLQEVNGVFMDAYHSADPEKRRIVDFILNLNC